MEEFWLKGEVKGFSRYLMPAAHALMQAETEILQFPRNFTNNELWENPDGASSIGFQLKHIAGSIDRLLTYCRSDQLTTEQFESLERENINEEKITCAELIENSVLKIREALKFISETTDNTLFNQRFVGRKKLPTNVFGLLFHIAEHTQRHLGQLITAAKIIESKR